MLESRGKGGGGTKEVSAGGEEVRGVEGIIEEGARRKVR